MPKNDKSSYYFYDINAKINHKFSDRSRLFLSAYNGKDHFGNKITEYSGDENKSKITGGILLSLHAGILYSTISYSAIRQLLSINIGFMPTHIPTASIQILPHTRLPPINILPTTAPVFRTGVIRWTLTTTPHPHIALSLVRNICITAFVRKS